MGLRRAKLTTALNRYFVVMPDGQRYGPATLPHLGDWVREGRVLPDTVLEDAQTGQRFYAGQIQGLPFGMQGPASGAAHHQSYSQPASVPHPSTIQDPYQAQYQPGYAQPGPSQTYPYLDPDTVPSSGLSVVSFVLSLIAALTCFGPLGIVLSLLGLVIGIVARTRNDRMGGCATTVAAATLAVALLFAVGKQMLVGGG